MTAAGTPRRRTAGALRKTWVQDRLAPVPEHRDVGELSWTCG